MRSVATPARRLGCEAPTRPIRVTGMHASSASSWSRLLGSSVLLGTLALALPAQDGLKVKNGLRVKKGQKIAFLGDSITAAGARGPAGYCRLVIRGLACAGVEATMIPAGISGHKSNQMLARLEKDVLAKKPDWMTLSCGVNDVWHGKRGVPLDQYKTNITAIVDRAQAQGIKVMILTSTMIHEDSSNDLNKRLAPYNAFLRELAKAKNCHLADLNAEMQSALITGDDKPKGNQLTSDGVHMNALGNIMMATGVLRAFGLKGDAMTEVTAEFEALPKICNVRINQKLSVQDFKKLRAAATAAGTSLEEMLQQTLDRKIAELLKN